LTKSLPARAQPDLKALSVERRQLTVMFCDLVDSTALSARVDPEELREITTRFLAFCTRCVNETNGFVARYAGDGILAYFGYPQIREDDAERAVQAALRIRDGLADLALPVAVAARIGIATGIAVIGDVIGEGPSLEHAVIGETPNLAARLEAAAVPNTIVVSDLTKRLAAGTFRFREIGPLSLKGLAAPVPAWEALGPNDAVNRFGDRNAQATSVFVGRDAQLARVLALAGSVGADGGLAIGVVGEAGIGKSRLLSEVRKILSREPRLWLEGGGAQLFRNTPFHLVSQMIRRRLSRGRALTPEAYIARLREALHACGIRDENALPLIAELIGIDAPVEQAPLALNAEQRRQALLDALSSWLIASAAQWPTVMLVEDLHWVDPSSLDLLTRVMEQAQAVPLLLLYSSREESGAHWPVGPRHERVALGPLSSEDCRRIVESVAGVLADSDVGRAVARAAGIPLYAQELGRLIGERGARNASEIPGTLSDLLLARLDQLGPIKRIAQVAAVLGSEFSLSLFRTMAGLEESDLKATLAVMAEAGILRASTASEPETLAFAHSMIRDAAYGAMLMSNRRILHRHAAEIMSEHLHLQSDQPEILAQHWTAAGEQDAALDAWQEAGRLAALRCAYVESQRAYEQATGIVVQFAESRRRDERELELRSALADILQITRGYSAPETVDAASTARTLAAKGGKLREQCAQLANAWMAASSQADYALAMRLADQLLPLSRADGDAEGLGLAYMIQMTTLYRTGELLRAEDAFAAGLGYFVESRFVERVGAIPQTFGNAALNALIIGNGDAARERIEHCLAVCRASANPYQIAFATHMAALVANVKDCPEEAERAAAESILHSDAHGFAQFAAVSRVLLGRARAREGRPEEGLRDIVDGLGRTDVSQSRNGRTMYFTWLAETQAACGEIDEAARTLDAALEFNPQERYFRPESLRLKAEFAMLADDPLSAETACTDAITLANSMAARLFHARASQTRLAIRTGRSEER
jgi:class 3 adenylate cyclase